VGISDQINPDLPVQIWGMSFNMTTVYMTVLTSLVLVVVAYLATRRLRRVPGRFQAFVESLAKFFYDIVEQALGREDARRFFPIIATLFFLILLSNIIGVVPFPAIVGTKHLEVGGEDFVDVNGNGVYDVDDVFTGDMDENGNGRRDAGFVVQPWHEPTRDMNTTIGLAIAMALITHIAQLKKKGLVGYIKDYFQPLWFMAPLNAIGRVVEVINTSFRLFGNIFGGAVIIVIISFLIHSLVLPIGLAFFFGLFAGTIQAFVFTMLWLSYLAVSLSEE
jgi:F-type H+-transporting ATPase subunit a